MLKLLDSLLSAFRFYRKWRGGTWYQIRDDYDAGGWGTPPEWTRIPREHAISIEHH